MNIVTARRPLLKVRNTGREYTVCLYRNDGDARGYWVDVPAVPGIITGGDSIRQALRRAREALGVHLEWLLEDGEPLPDDGASSRPDVNRPILIQKVRVMLARR